MMQYLEEILMLIAAFLGGGLTVYFNESIKENIKRKSGHKKMIGDSIIQAQKSLDHFEHLVSGLYGLYMDKEYPKEILVTHLNDLKAQAKKVRVTLAETRSIIGESRSRMLLNRFSKLLMLHEKAAPDDVLDQETIKSIEKTNIDLFLERIQVIDKSQKKLYK